MYKGEIILREIQYAGKNPKYAFEVIEDKLGITLKNIIKSKSVLRLLSDGVVIEFIDKDNNSLYILEKREKYV